MRPGIHRFAMLDSRWDEGITTSEWDVFWIKFMGIGGSKAQKASSMEASTLADELA